MASPGEEKDRHDVEQTVEDLVEPTDPTLLFHAEDQFSCSHATCYLFIPVHCKELLPSVTYQPKPYFPAHGFFLAVTTL